MNNVSLPTGYQWKRIALNSVFVFLAAFIAALQSLGFNFSEPQLLLQFDVSLSVLASAAVTGCFAVIKALWTTFFEPPVK